MNAPDAEARDGITCAGLFAALYGDPDDPEFMASPCAQVLPTRAHLEEYLPIALAVGQLDLALLIIEVLNALDSGRVRSACHGNRSGLWRLQ